MSNKSRELLFAATAAASNVDAAAGRINNVILITCDREATGHGIWIDAQTLETALAGAPDTKRILAYNHHPSGEDYVDGNGSDRWDEAVGYFENLRIDGNSLLGDFVAYDAFRNDSAGLFNRLFEMAAKTPELVNMSIESWGYAVFVGKDGKEYSGQPSDDVGLVRELPSYRVTDLNAAAFVADGAATDTLFASVKKFFSRIAAKLTGSAPAASAAPADTQAATAPAADAPAAPAAAPVENVSEQLSKKFAADSARLTRALALARESASLTVEEIETILSNQDRDADIERLTELSESRATEIAELKQKLAKAESDLDAARKDAAAATEAFTKLKNSGFDGALNLGGAARITKSEADLIAEYSTISDPVARGEFYAKHISPLRTQKK